MSIVSSIISEASNYPATSAGGAGGLNIEDIFSTYMYGGNGVTSSAVNAAADSTVDQDKIHMAIFTAAGNNLGDNTADRDYYDDADFLIGSYGGGGSSYGSYSRAYRLGLFGANKSLGKFINLSNPNATGGQEHFGGVTTFTFGTAVPYYIDDINNADFTSVTNIESGDLIILWTAVPNAATAQTLPTGFTEVYHRSESGTYGYNERLAVKIADGTENGTNYGSTVLLSDYDKTSGIILRTDTGSFNVSEMVSSVLSNDVNTLIRSKIDNEIDLKNEGGLVWIKNRSGDGHFLFDTERGAQKRLRTHGTDAENTDNQSLLTFNDDGFTIGSNASMNPSSDSSIASWTWRKAPKFFDVVTYSGNSTARTISHNLGATPGVIIVKNRDTDDWIVYHRSLGATQHLELNNTNGAATYDMWNDTAPTSTEFSLSSYQKVNETGKNYVAYLFAHNDGDGEFGPTGDQDVIKCGSYTGNGSTTGPEIDLGFEPQWLMIKNTSSSSGDWNIFDTIRGIPHLQNDSYLAANTSAAEGALYNSLDLTSTGFQPKVDYTYINNTGLNYIYVAIRRGPMAVPVKGFAGGNGIQSHKGVFKIDTTRAISTKSTPSWDVNFPVDMTITRNDQTNSSWANYARLMGNTELFINTNAAGQNAGGAEWDYMEGWGDLGSASSSLTSWNWRRAPNFFDVVAYKGNSTSGRAITHNLGVAPEMIWVKIRDDAGQWTVYNKTITAEKYMHTDNADAANTSSIIWTGVEPTDTVFYTGSHVSTNHSSYNYIAYLFASLDGVSKIGSYDGSSSDQIIDCGFAEGAGFIIIKSITHTTSWAVFDWTRSYGSGNDSIMYLNDNAAPVTLADYVDKHPSGFVVKGGQDTVNSAGRSYIFYAISRD